MRNYQKVDPISSRVLTSRVPGVGLSAQGRPELFGGSIQQEPRPSAALPAHLDRAVESGESNLDGKEELNRGLLLPRARVV